MTRRSTRLVGLVWCSLCMLTLVVSSYRLKVHKVLFPFQTSNATSFKLEASNGGHGSGAADTNADLCLTWSVNLINSRCFFACFICFSNYIRRQTTNRLSPESLTVGDSDADSASISSAGDSRNVLRSNKFIDSEYEVSESIGSLEALGLSGHKIIIEGLKNGTANERTKLVAFYTQPLASSSTGGYGAEVALHMPLVRLLVADHTVDLKQNQDTEDSTSAFKKAIILGIAFATIVFVYYMYISKENKIRRVIIRTERRERHTSPNVYSRALGTLRNNPTKTIRYGF